MEAEQEKNGSIDNNGNIQAAVTEIVVLDSDGSESHRVDGGAAAKTGSSFRLPIPPFLLKIYDMLENNETNSVITWSCNGTCFLITDTHLFAANVLPMYFRHNNFQSFVSQLNTYGFRKISWEKWEYKNEYFRKGERHLLKNIKRRNQISHNNNHPSNMENELETMIKEQDLLNKEITKLKDKQEILEQKIASLKKQAISNIQKDQKIIMLAAEDILRNRKRKFEEKSDTTDQYDEKIMVNCSEFGSGSNNNSSLENILEFMSQNLSQQGKIVLNEEEMKTREGANAFISLEDMIGESSSDWIVFFKDLLEKASRLKS
ncbi:hypothetical protein DH2020_041851 [Rehmannia glutinosa]|uniref:HSF-type DNA-binding domain-containing protein n=1 Tax=Rehmannia glutinosa TaxID=99300 RepID=A0ABR0UPP8_REHGL